MKKLQNTLEEVVEVLEKEKIEFALTRFNFQSKIEPDDLDVLVHTGDFKKAVSVLEDERYVSSSHDHSFGGRIKGMQINLVKPSRTKIDLHQDFTWRKTRYLDLDLIWNNLEEREVGGVKVKVPKKEIDAFIIIINIIFEKTYITKEDLKYIKTEEGGFWGDTFRQQAEKYGWPRTYKGLLRWWHDRERRTESFPVFLPASLVIFSYLEKLLHDKKLDLVSLLYYFFFRTRYLVNKTLPYE